jgi:alpha-glucosidase (family GH31 glycosyl hydrolase)
LSRPLRATVTPALHWLTLRDAFKAAVASAETDASDQILNTTPADDLCRLRAFQCAALLPAATHLQDVALPATPAMAVCARLALQLRARLQPYLYSLCALEREYNWPLLRSAPTDAFLLGDALLVAPVLEPGASRTVRLPDGVWFDFWSDRRYAGGQSIDIVAPLERLPLFVRAGAVVPLAAPTSGQPQRSTLRVYPGDYESTLYEDSGQSQDYADGNFRWSYITSVSTTDGLRLTRRSAGRYNPPYAEHRLEIFGLPGTPVSVQVDRRSAPLWYTNAGRLECTVPDDFSAVEVRFS